MARACDIDLFQCTTVGIGKFVRGYTYNWPILGVKLSKPLVNFATVRRDNIGNAEGSPKQRTGVVAEWMEECVVEAVYERRLCID